MSSLLRTSAALVLAVASPALAQSDTRATVDRCVAALPDSALTRVPLFADVELRDSTAQAALPMVSVFVQLLGAQARALLGAGADELPVGDHVMSWRGVHRDLQLVLYRDGRVAWTIEPDSLAPADVVPPAALLARAAEAVRDAGQRPDWPADLAADSVAASVVLRHASVTRDGKVTPPRVRLVEPIVSLAVPWRSPVSVVEFRPPSYPRSVQTSGTEGVVIMRYVVEPTGRVDAASIRDVWNSPEPRPTGARGREYRALVKAVSDALLRARFKPAAAGGCAVPQLVQQVFNFSIAQP